jgi:glycosyltransferase involved in cell wall biosynthesis
MPVRISVIVPTHNRKDLLLPLLESLLRQSLPSEMYEVIVVCDGVTDGTNDQVRAMCRDHSQLRLIELPQGGPGAARNAGARIAEGKYLAFTDDDCLASREWLEKLIEPFEQPDILGVEGRTTSNTAERTPLTHQMESAGSSLVMPTCNVGYRREAFEQLGGFEVGFPFPHNEDVDFTWRLRALGKVSYAAEAVIIHPPRPESFAKKARWVRYLESEFLLFARNPDAYRKHRSPSPWMTIYWRVFVIYQLHYIRTALGYLINRRRPDYSLITIALMFARWWNLIRFFPGYLRAARTVSSQGRNASQSALDKNVTHRMAE